MPVSVTAQKEPSSTPMVFTGAIPVWYFAGLVPSPSRLRFLRVHSSPPHIHVFLSVSTAMVVVLSVAIVSNLCPGFWEAAGEFSGVRNLPVV